MKIVFFVAFLLFSNSSFSQLISGDLVSERRRLLTETNFTLEGNSEGTVAYELAVDREGKVTSTLLKSELTTITSTPLKMEANNYLKGFVFEPGTYYPKFHHVIVKITFVKPIKK
jgi:hypothetical protein